LAFFLLNTTHIKKEINKPANKSKEKFMNKKKLLIVFALIFSVGFLGCKKQENKSQEQQTPQQENQNSAEGSNQTQANAPETSIPASTPPAAVQADNNNTQKQVKKTIISLKRVNFSVDKYFLTQEARITLSQNSKTLLKNGKASIIIEGHCDETGSQKYNYILGLKRANNVKKYYVSLGVPAQKIKIVSYGKKRLLDKSGSESAKAKNRRAETKIIR
jgi:peptidoglycan-associated lipoprotein